MRKRSPPCQSGKVERNDANSKENPYISNSSFEILEVQGFGGIVENLSEANTASISRLGREQNVENTPASTVKTDSGRSVYSISRDVTNSGGVQYDSDRQAGLADEDTAKRKNNRYLCHSDLKCNVGEVNEALGHSSDRKDEFSRGSDSEKVDLNVNVNKPIHVFTSSEGVIVNVFDECAKGVCSCDWSLQGEKLQLKPCRFAYLVSLGTAQCRKVYEPLVSNITDGFKIVDDTMNLVNMQYECENYKTVYDPLNNEKLDNIIRKELKEGNLKIVPEKPTCIHSMGAVPKPDGGIRPITDCSMPRDISVDNYCSDIIE